jgi:hypothetical protein
MFWGFFGGLLRSEGNYSSNTSLCFSRFVGKKFEDLPGNVEGFKLFVFQEFAKSLKSFGNVLESLESSIFIMNLHFN